MIKIYQGNCLDRLKDLPAQSINTCITSPPFWNLRDYQEEEQLGMEDTPEEFVDNLVGVFREVKRVLHDSGTVWLNLGDSYISGKSRYSNKEQTLIGGGENQKKYGILHKGGKKDMYGHPYYKDKDLAGIPWRVALALQQDGWYLRQDIIWHKPNPLPESVTDRCTKAHEYIFLLSKNKKYYYDNEAIKEDAKNAGRTITLGAKSFSKRQAQGMNVNPSGNAFASEYKVLDKRNKRSVWTVTTKPFRGGAHFATFPMDLIEPCVLAGCPERVCVECGEPYIKKYERKDNNKNYIQVKGTNTPNISKGGVRLTEKGTTPHFNPPTIKFLGFNKDCKCETEKYESGTVLDPFGGAGTTALVAMMHNRKSVLIELNEEYIEITKERLAPKDHLFTPKIEIDTGEQT